MPFFYSPSQTTETFSFSPPKFLAAPVEIPLVLCRHDTRALLATPSHSIEKISTCFTRQ